MVAVTAVVTSVAAETVLAMGLVMVEVRAVVVMKLVRAVVRAVEMVEVRTGVVMALMRAVDAEPSHRSPHLSTHSRALRQA